MSQKSITLVWDYENLLPLKGKRVFAISPPLVRTSIADNAFVKHEIFCAKAAEALNCDYAEISINPNIDEIAEIVQRSAYADIILLGSYSAVNNIGQVKLFHAFKAAGKKVVVISLRAPYDILKMPDADAYIAAYEYTSRSVSNAIKALTGEIPFKGSLPVEI